MTEWRVIDVQPLYEVSDNGEIRNTDTGRILKLQYVNGYHAVYITRDKKTKGYLVHRLVARAFLPAPNEGAVCVDHIDRNKLNNSVQNLRWVTSSQNNCNRKRWGTSEMHHITRVKNGYSVSFMTRAQITRQTFEKLDDAIAYRDRFMM
jgi:hypothetical protein